MLQLLGKLLVMIPTMIFATDVAITWEWMIDDPQVTGFRYQLDDENPDNWIVVDGNTTTAVFQNLDGSKEYALYLQQTFDGIDWSDSAVSVAYPLFEAEDTDTAVADKVTMDANTGEIQETEAMPVEDAVVAEEAMPAEDAVVAEEAMPVEDEMVAEEAMPVEDEMVAEEAMPAEDAVVAEEAMPAEDEMVAEEAMPAEDAVVAEEEMPAEDAVVAEEAMPAEDEMVAEDAMPMEDVVVVEAEEETPAVEETKMASRYYTSIGLEVGASNDLNVLTNTVNSASYLQFKPVATLALGFNNIKTINSVVGLGLNLDISAVDYIDSSSGVVTEILSGFQDGSNLSMKVSIAPEIEFDLHSLIIDLGLVGDMTLVNVPVIGTADLDPTFDFFNYGVFSYGAKLGMALQVSDHVQYAVDGSITKVNDLAAITDGDWAISAVTGFKFTF